MTLALFTLLYACAPPKYTDLNGNGKMEPYENENLSLDERADDIIDRLSTADKINLVVGIGLNIPGMFEASQPLRVPGAVGGTYTFDSLGINGLITTDGPAGVRIFPIEGTPTYYCTAFPIASLLSSTWDVDLAYQIGDAMGNEVKEYGMDILLAPALNIHRDPRGGRNFEYFSEDPLLSGKMASAVVNGVQSNGVGTSLKHFVANNQETNRTAVDVRVSQRALREIYLKGFEIAVKESSPWTVMSSYNQINGTPASQNSELLTGILREEWGYDGFVMTDWFAGTDAAEQMRAGNDLLMPGTNDQRETLTKAVNDGTLDVAILDRNAKRILKILLQSPSFNRYEYSNKPDLEANAQLARQVAAEGAVLLKNEGVLPLSPNELAVGAFGIGSYEFIAGGTGSGDVNEAYTISLVQGLENAGISIDEGLRASYDQYIKVEKDKLPKPEFILEVPELVSERPLTQSELERAVASTDVALITLGRISGEGEDRELEGDFYLAEAEIAMIKGVSSAYHEAGKKVVVILNIGNVIETDSWKDMVDAILLPWQGGQEAGNAVVDVLTGKTNPSGKLPTTFPISYDDVPSAKNFPGEEYGEEININALFRARPSHVAYEEGIYVGYRYYSTFDKEVSYPFGVGLSYTSFDYSASPINYDDGTIAFSVNVKNTGEIAGKEIVQAYITAPGNQLDQPAKELRAFGKTGKLNPGESQELKFTISAGDYASFDSRRSSWVVEPGKYQVEIGASSEDIRQTLPFEVSKELIIEKLSPLLQPEGEINELHPD